MKKLALLALLTIGFSGLAQTGAKIEFKQQDNTIDYGTVSKDMDSGLRTFEFTNTGDAPLIITDAKSTCGCTVPSFSREPILPGKTGKIDVKYNMNPGTIRKTITLETNATNYAEGTVAIKIKGEVVVKKEVNPLEKKKSILDQE